MQNPCMNNALNNAPKLGIRVWKDQTNHSLSLSTWSNSSPLSTILAFPLAVL